MPGVGENISLQFCAKIMEARRMFPHLRIGQLIVNAITYNLYNIGDEKLVEAIDAYMKMYDPKRKS